jgi:hypothetical protein
MRVVAIPVLPTRVNRRLKSGVVSVLGGPVERDRELRLAVI